MIGFGNFGRETIYEGLARHDGFMQTRFKNATASADLKMLRKFINGRMTCRCAAV
jgi:hypothetical protein